MIPLGILGSPGSAVTTVDRFDPSGTSTQIWTVPDGVKSVIVRVQGAAGGSGNSPFTGMSPGDLVEAIVDVSSTTQLKILVGQPGEGGIADATTGQGQNKGGWPGGGNAGAPTWNIYPAAFIQPGGGGGYSMIRTDSDLDVVVAAGGPGTGGMDGSLNGGSATTTTGGAAGYSPNGSPAPATAGSKYQGGNGAANNYVQGTQYHPGGGGGGGYYGGGGGGTKNAPGAFGSGGRGSSYTDPSLASQVSILGGSTGAGFVEIIWTVGPATSGDFEPIATVTVGSGGASSIEFTSIPGTYQHLQIRGLLRTDYANITTGSYLEFNSDTTGPYSAHRILGTGSAASAYGEANISLGTYTGLDAGATNTSGVFAGIILDILDYANTSKATTHRSFSGFDSNGQGWIAVYSGLWTSTSAVSSLKIKFGGSAKFVQYTTLALYGIRS